MALGEVTTVERVQAQLATDMTDAEAVDVASMDAAVTDANALVLGHLMLNNIDDFADFARESVAAIATRIACRIYKNPREQSGYGYGDTNISYSDPRILTGDERTALAPYRNTVRGPIYMQPRPISDISTALGWDGEFRPLP